MRGWTAEERRIRGQQTSPRNHNGLIFDTTLDRHNANELANARTAMFERYMESGDWEAIEAPDDENAPAVEMVTCSCGHIIPRSDVMNASLGTSCPDCYDRMSA